jgi:hypothetical protein
LRNISDELNIYSYEAGGIHIIRDDRLFILIRCGRFGFDSGGGGHCHNDQLSFELNIDGIDIIIDPGTYVYSSDFKARNEFRCTRAHNTPQIKNTEQNPFREKEIFKLIDHTKATVNRFEPSNNTVLFEGQHEGYFLQYGGICKRRILYNPLEKIVEIKDWFDRKMFFRDGFTFDEAAIPVPFGNKSLKVLNNIKIDIKGDYEINDTYMSKSYGIRSNTKRIEVHSFDNEYIKISF